MQKINDSMQKINNYTGKWVVILNNRIITVGESLKDIESFISRDIKDKTPVEQIPAAFKVPYKDEGPYVL